MYTCQLTIWQSYTAYTYPIRGNYRPSQIPWNRPTATKRHRVYAIQ